MTELLRRLLRDEDGQDVIEYALLTAGIGLMGVVAWPAIAAGIGDAYQRFDTRTQNIWELRIRGRAHDYCRRFCSADV